MDDTTRRRAGAVHVPVLASQIVELLAPALQGRGAVVVDCTLGLGGHTRELLLACPDAVAIGIDRDQQALTEAAVRLAEFAPRVRYVHAVYDQLRQVLAELEIELVQAVLLDFGLSSLQIDAADRGFAYATDAPLDMRMDQKQALTAAEVVNSYSRTELARILSWYGEERFADRIASRIVAAREQQPFDTSARLVAVITESIPMGARHSGGHPAKRSFQALRIEVNDELSAVRDVLPAAIDALSPGGRIAVLAYHSLEDRLVKREFAAAAQDRAPRGLPVVPAGMGPRLKLLTRGAVRPSPSECQANPRAASARLRAAERTEEPRMEASVA